MRRPWRFYSSVAFVSLLSSLLVLMLSALLIPMLGGGFFPTLLLLPAVHLVFALRWAHTRVAWFAEQPFKTRYVHSLGWAWGLMLTFVLLFSLFYASGFIYILTMSLAMLVTLLCPVWLTVPFLTLEVYRWLYLKLALPPSTRATLPCPSV